MKKNITSMKVILLTIVASSAIGITFILKEFVYNNAISSVPDSNLLSSDGMFESHLRDAHTAFDKITACHKSGYLVASSFHGHFAEVINISNGETKALLGVPGSPGNSNGYLQNPHGVACDEKNHNIVIADSGNRRIAVYDLKSFRFLRKIEIEDYLSDITIDPTNDRLLILSGGSHSLGGCCNVVAINNYNDAKLSREVVIPMRKEGDNITNYNLYIPSSLFADHASNQLYIVDDGHSRVQVFDLTTFSYMATLGVSGVPGSDNVHLKEPMGIAIDNSKDNIFISDMGNRRIQVYDKKSYMRKYTVNGKHVILPRSITFINNRLYTIDINSGYVVGNAHNYINVFKNNISQ